MGCTSNSRSKIANNSAQITDLLMQQQQSWNNGDLEGFMSHYWNSDSLCFLSKRGLNCGWKSVYANYKKSYNTKDKMGRLDFTVLKSKPLTDSSHFLVGQWQVSRTQDTLKGSFNLIWELKNGKWVIVFDHTS